MLFTDNLFLFYFLPFSLLAHRFFAQFNRAGEYGVACRLTIFLLTCVFYGFKEPWWLIPFFICIGFDFLWAFLLTRTEDPTRRKLVVSLSVIQNLGLLTIFKYWGFLTATVVQRLPALQPYFPQLTFNESALPLPPGISFYTFESLSFVIDVYRRHVRSVKTPLEFFAFIGMFPRFVAGPIVRYRDVVSQFAHYRGMQIEKGLFIFIVGLFTKLCLADSFEIFVPYAFGRPFADDLSFPAVAIGTLAYSMQIYFDFSGYSMMAIGLGRCFGFQFPINFNRPYAAITLQDFWRRWHISLSSWLRDYLYISLGGNRRGKWRSYLNVFITMTIGGIWHGSNWVFLLWGVWHGFWLCVERAVGLSGRLHPTVHRIFTFGLVVCGWVFFRAGNTQEAFKLLKILVNPFHQTFAFNPSPLLINPLPVFFCLVGILYAFVIEPRMPNIEVSELEGLTLRHRAVAAAMFTFSLAVLFSARTIPFLYFRF